MAKQVLFGKVRCRMGHRTSLRRLVSGAREAAATLTAWALSQVLADVVTNFGFKRINFSCGQLLKQLLSVTGAGRRSLPRCELRLALPDVSDLRDLTREV